MSPEERVAQVRAVTPPQRALAFPLEGGALTGAAEFGYDEPPAPDPPSSCSATSTWTAARPSTG